MTKKSSRRGWKSSSFEFRHSSIVRPSPAMPEQSEGGSFVIFTDGLVYYFLSNRRRHFDHGWRAGA
jgi:hypothetical protein